MMIKCQDCGYENQMGSIFCRKCGVKLNMDALDPKLLNQNAKKEDLKKKSKKFVKNLIINIVVLVLLIAFLATIFYNGGLRTYSEPEVTKSSLNTKLKNMENGTVKGSANETISFTDAELTNIVMERLKPTILPSSMAELESVEVVFEDDRVTTYSWIKLFGKVSVLYTISGDLEYIPKPEFHPQFNGQEEPHHDYMNMNIKKMTIGRLPIFFRYDLFTGPVEGLLKNEDLNIMVQYVDRTELSDGKYKVTYRKKPAKKDE